MVDVDQVNIRFLWWINVKTPGNISYTFLSKQIDNVPILHSKLPVLFRYDTIGQSLFA